MSCTRRAFLSAAASGLVIGARAAGAAAQGAQGANDRIRIGVIGTAAGPAG
jgi:hypothetical protein